MPDLPSRRMNWSGGVHGRGAYLLNPLCTVVQALMGVAAFSRHDAFLSLALGWPFPSLTPSPSSVSFCLCKRKNSANLLVWLFESLFPPVVRPRGKDGRRKIALGGTKEATNWREKHREQLDEHFEVAPSCLISLVYCSLISQR